MSRKGDRRAQLQQRRAALQARLAAHRRQTPKPGRPRRQWVPWVLVVILAAILLLRACEEPPEEVVCEPCDCAEEPGEPVESEPVAADPPLGGRVRRTDRGSYRSTAARPLGWIAAFRMQVAARSTRLSACFEGVDRPGTFKWTTSVEPVAGRTSEHVLEPMIQTDELTSRQRTCVLEVLTSPGYDLVTGDEPATPSRVSLVVEF
jgi:hypothetical protein